LSLGIGAIGAVALTGLVAPAHAKNDAAQQIRRFTGGRRPNWGKVSLDLPDIAESGNSIRMSVSVESPMTERAHVTDVLVVADGNSHGGVATFHFSPASGAASATTFIRLGSKQNVIAVAKMNDGSFYMNNKYVRVAIGGCCS
jgi:sulfur-oxidizing protein SoxY